MELANLLSKFTHQPSPQEKEYFWALEIWEGGVKSAIWTVEEGKIQVVILGSQELWQEDVEDLVTAADQSFATASERFVGIGKEPSKVIFGLPPDWLEEEKIIPSRQHMLQTLCEKLALSPLGFVLVVDALNHHLKDVEGVPPSGILVNPQKKQVLVAVLEIGKIKGVEQIKRSEDLTADVYEGLSRFGELKTLPSRILLFNGEDMEAARQILIDFSWTSKLPFLHFPKIEILPQDFDINALCLAGGSEVAKSLGFEVMEIQKDQTATVEPDFGFVRGEDIQKKMPEPIPEPAQTEETIEEISEVEKPKLTFPLFTFLEGIKETISGFSLPRLPGIPLLGLVGGGVLFLGVASFIFLWSISRARVTIYVTPKLLEKEIELTVDPTQDVIDETSLLLPGKVLEIEVKGDKTEETTGQKTVGEKAKGGVTIFNIGNSKNLVAGTVLTGPGGLKFTLDQVVSVASGSALGGPGQARANITAADIGADYNLAGGSEFTIANVDKSVLAAKNESALTGGTSRQIQAVSEEDQKNLLGRLTEELKAKGKSDLMANVPPGKKLIEESITTKESSRSFNHKVGEEASSLTLSLRVKVKALIFSQDDLLSLIEKQIASSTPGDYEAKKEEIKTQLEILKSKEDGSALVKVVIAANLLPKIQSATIAQSIKGKTTQDARVYLSQLPGFADAEIEISPSLPALILRLPRAGKNIEIEIKSK